LKIKLIIKQWVPFCCTLGDVDIIIIDGFVKFEFNDILLFFADQDDQNVLKLVVGTIK
jgi:hypothetical protein